MDNNAEPDAETMPNNKEHVAAHALAEALLEYGLKPGGSELQRECTQHYLDELRFLKLFSVDYVLGLKAVRVPAFESVRMHYNERLESFCESKESPFSYATVTARFDTYTEACNANTLSPKEYKGKPLVFWELGKAISRLASNADRWVPSAMEVTLHANIFVSDCLSLTEFIDRYEVTQTV